MKKKGLIGFLLLCLMLGSSLVNYKVDAKEYEHEHTDANNQTVDFSEATSLNDYLKDEENIKTFDYQKNTSNSFKIVMLQSGNYKLTATEEIEVYIGINENSKVNICLNGYTLTTLGTLGYYTHTVSTGGQSVSYSCYIDGELNIFDCPNGEDIGTLKIVEATTMYKRTNAAVLCVGGNGAINLYGGKITTGNKNTIFLDEGAKLHAYGGIIANESKGPSTIRSDYGTDILLDNATVISRSGNALELEGTYTTNGKPSTVVVRNGSKLYSENNEDDYGRSMTIDHRQGVLTIENSTVESKNGYAISSSKNSFNVETTLKLTNATLISGKTEEDEYDVDYVVTISGRVAVELKGNNVFKKNVGVDIDYHYKNSSNEDNKSIPMEITGVLSNTTPISVYVSTFDDDPELNVVNIIKGFDTYMPSADYKKYFSCYKKESEVFISKDTDKNININRLIFTEQPTSETKKGTVNKDDRTPTYQWYEVTTKAVDNTMVDNTANGATGTYDATGKVWSSKSAGNNFSFYQSINNLDNYDVIEFVIPKGSYTTTAPDPSIVTGMKFLSLVEAGSAFKCKIEVTTDGTNWITLTDETSDELLYVYDGEYNDGYWEASAGWSGYVIDLEYEEATSYRVTFAEDVIYMKSDVEDYEDYTFTSKLNLNYIVRLYKFTKLTSETAETLSASKEADYLVEAKIDEAIAKSEIFTLVDNNQTLSFKDSTITKTYDDAKYKQEVTGAKTTVTYSSSDTNIATVNSSTGEVTFLKVGTVTIKASAIASGNYEASEATYTLTINQVKVDVPTAKSGLIYNGKNQTGVEAVASAKYTLTNNSATNAGDYTAKATLNDKVNYVWNLETPTSDDQTIAWSIAKKELTVVGTMVDEKAYDGTKAAKIGTTGTLSDYIEGDDVSIDTSTAEFASENAANSIDVTVVYTLKGTKANNYTVANSETFADITKKDIKITADDKETRVGKALETLTYTVDKDTTLCGDDKLTGELRTEANKNNVNTYEIKQGTLTAGDNYNIIFTKGTYTVAAKEVQTLTFTDTVVNKTYGDAKFTQGVNGASTVLTYESSDTAIATVKGPTGEVTILKPGTVTITVTAAEDEDHEAASASYEIIVSKKQVAISAIVGKYTYNDADQSSVLTASYKDINGTDVALKINTCVLDTISATDDGTIIEFKKAGKYVVWYTFVAADEANYYELTGNKISYEMNAKLNDIDNIAIESGGKGKYKEAETSDLNAHIKGFDLTDVKEGSSGTNPYTYIVVSYKGRTLTYDTEYTVSAGSIRIILKKAFLDTLGVGEHKVDVSVKTNVDIDYTFEIPITIEAGYKNVNTSVSNNRGLELLSLMTLVTISGAIIFKKEGR